MLFDNTKIGFVLKSNFELEKAYFLFKIISNKTLTDFGKILLNIILTFKLPFLFIVKRTVFKQFCSGSNLEESMEKMFIHILVILLRVLKITIHLKNLVKM